MKAAYYTLGCKVNQYDTEAMRELLEADGFATVDFDTEADVYLINTCTVTNIADRKSRQMIARAHKRNPRALICVCGCLAQRDAAKILAIPGVGAAVGTSCRAQICQIVRNALEKGAVDSTGEILKERLFEEVSVSKSGEKTRAHIKICEGCNNFCTYCVIPYVRGPVRSRPIEQIISEAKRLAQSGVQEMVLTGIHISSYGKDLGDTTLIDVVRGVAQHAVRIRLGSLEPKLLTREFCRQAAEISQLCPHFHVSLQSGSDGVLRRMGRRYTVSEYEGYIENLRRQFENPAITTDLIAGFPQETQAEHEETLSMIRRIGFAKIHVFPYSEREGTAAAQMTGQIPHALRKTRAAELSLVALRMEEEYLDGFLGQEEEVLLEERTDGGRCVGHTTRYARLSAPGAAGQSVRVRVVSREGTLLLGELL